MYTEIRELINFLARYFHLRIPRLRIGMFCEHMANNCLFRFQPYWNINMPKQHEEQRIIRISRAFCDETFTSAANSVGLMLEELLNCLPEHLILYVNPGEVFYCSCDYSPPVPIWLGSVNEDLSYNEQKVSGHSLIPPPPLPSNILPPSSIQPLNSLFSPLHSNTTSIAALFTGQRNTSNVANILDSNTSNVDFTVLDWRINLSLVSPRELGYEYTNPYTGFRMFRYVLPGAPNFTVETFAITRFGSFRKRPEHEKIFVDKIKDFVNSETGGGGVNATTIESNSATTTTSTRGNCGGIWSSSNEGLWMMSDELKQLNF